MLFTGDSQEQHLPHASSSSCEYASLTHFQHLMQCMNVQSGLQPLWDFFTRSKQQWVMPQAAKTLADFQMGLPPSKCPILEDFQHHQASTTLTPQESTPADTCSEGRVWHLTHHFGLERWLDLSVFQFFPVNSPEESMFPDVSFTFKATAEALCRMFSH